MKRNKKKALDRLLSQALCDAKKAESFDVDSIEEIYPSKDFLERMELLTEKKEKRGAKISVFFARPTAFIAMLFIFAAVLAVGIGAYEVIEWFVLKYQESTTIVSTEVPKDIKVPEKIEREYFISEIPEGYSPYFTSRHNGEIVQCAYKNGEGEVIRFEQYTLGKGSFAFNTEDVPVADILVCGYSGYYYKNFGSTTLIWHTEEYLFMLCVPDSFGIDRALSMADDLIYKAVDMKDN